MLNITPRSAGYRLPAEWEKQRAVWLSWPHEKSDFPGKLSAVRWVYCEMISWLSRTAQVELLVQDEEGKLEAEQHLRVSNVHLDNVQLRILPTNRSWTRDYLPSWLISKDSSDSALAAVKWQFNGWARYDDHVLDEAAGQSVAEARGQKLWLPDRPVRSALEARARFVLEGGAIDTDGQGTILTTRDCLLGKEYPRNAGLTQTEIEGVLSNYLAADRVIWLPGDVAGDDTSGHVDDVARFVGPGRVVIPVESNREDPNYRPLLDAHKALEQSCDARGRALQVIDLPMPAPRFYEDSRLPATYANFLIANELVLVPTFNDLQDRVALGILAEIFPERQVVGIHCADLVLGLGAIHCSTNHEPEPTINL